MFIIYLSSQIVPVWLLEAISVGFCISLIDTHDCVCMCVSVCMLFVFVFWTLSYFRSLQKYCRFMFYIFCSCLRTSPFSREAFIREWYQKLRSGHSLCSQLLGFHCSQDLSADRAGNSMHEY